MKRFLTISVLFFSVVTCFSQNVTILGYAPDYKGKEISLYTYADYVSNIEIPVASSMVDDSSRFEFSLQSDDTRKVVLRSGKQKATMYVQPQKLYKVYYPKRDSVRMPNPNIEQSVELLFLVSDTTEINSRIISFNERFDQFWMENYQHFLKSHARYKLDTFELKTNKYYEKVDDPYFKTYLTYTFADLDFSTFSSRKDIAEKYLINEKIMYDNAEYMNLFNKFFKQYFQKIQQTKEGAGIVEQVNEATNYDGCMRILSSDHVLQNDTLRELVLIKGLSEAYYTDQFKKQSVIRLLDNIAIDSKIEKHRIIAGNVIRSFSKLQPGALAPDFSLKDRAGKVLSLSDLKGKYIYLDFWASWCTPCIQEMKLIPELKRRYGDKIVFVSISVDDSVATMGKFIDKLAKNKKVKYDWHFLHADSDTKVKDDYEIKTLPGYFLIDPNGKFVQSPALRPSEKIESVFYSLTRDRRRNSNQIK